jgi:hypothetical protein
MLLRGDPGMPGVSIVPQLSVRRGRAAVELCGELPGEVEATLAVQIDVDDRHVRFELPNAGQSFGRRGRHVDNGESLTLEEL